MQRRSWVALATTTSFLGLASCSSGPVQVFPDIAAAMKAIESLASGHKKSGAWTLAQMLNHAAQSIEFSIQGFPQMKSGAFRHTVGAAAFAVFDARGKMSHALDEPIPGAAALDAGAALPEAIERALKAWRDFEAHSGVLKPHFAYGELNKLQYTRAHLMHLANHWNEISLAAAPSTPKPVTAP
jgi:Protein of unknown function (DUF1569)